MTRKLDTSLSPDQIERMGQMAIFFSEHTYELTKTKLLKLVYLAEELFVKKHATPFLGVPFNAWQFGPVQKELWTSLDPAMELYPGPLSKYVSIKRESNDRYYIKNLCQFSDDEFSDHEISTLTHIAEQYKYHDAQHLVFITHKVTSLWSKAVAKVPGLMERFDRKELTTSNVLLDFADLFDSESIREFYYSQLDLLAYSNSIKYY